MDDIYIEKVLKGDFNAFQYFVKTYGSFAFSLSFSILKNYHEAEDAVQESFVKAFKFLVSFKRNSSFQTWLGKIVINESLRKTKPGKSDTVLYTEMSEFEPEIIKDSINTLAGKERIYFINLAFEKLSPNESLALELFYLKDYSIEEIKGMTGWSDSKTKMLLSRGRKNFYYQLKIILKSEIKEII